MPLVSEVLNDPVPDCVEILKCTQRHVQHCGIRAQVFRLLQDLDIEDNSSRRLIENTCALLLRSDMYWYDEDTGRKSLHRLFSHGGRLYEGVRYDTELCEGVIIVGARTYVTDDWGSYKLYSTYWAMHIDETGYKLRHERTIRGVDLDTLVSEAMSLSTYETN